MDLDFTALNGMAFEEPDTEAKEEAGGAWHRRIDREKEDRAKATQMYKAYQNNIKKAGGIRTEIIKGLNAGEDPLDLLLKAVECISLLTGDTAIYTQGRETIQAVYGWGLRRPAPLKLELEEARERLSLLTRPGLLEANITEGEHTRIQTAIKAHRELIEGLEREIEAGRQ